MSASPAFFSVTLHHVAPKLDATGPEFPDEDRPCTAAELRKLLQTFSNLAPMAKYPAEPELRIGGPHGRFLVQARNGQVKVISWSTQGVGTDMTPDRIFAMIVGMEEGEAVAEPTPGWLAPFAALSRNGKIALLALVIIGSNAVTAWYMSRPPSRLPLSLLPAYTAVGGERGERVIADFVGEYETGRKPGDRRLKIGPDGSLRWVSLGDDLKPTDDETLVATPAESGGKPVLVASNQGMIEMKDPITLVYFGDTYRRVVAR